MTDVLIQGENLGIETYTEKRQCEEIQRQNSHLPVKEKPGIEPTLTASERINPADTLILDFYCPEV